jgi:DNA polymerase-3 subunit alpha
MSKFVHLHTHSHYSLLDGLAKIDEMVARAKELGMDALALTDHGNLYGSIEYYKAARKAGIKPILGVEAYLAPRSRFDRSSIDSERYYHVTLLAKNNDGWKNLIELVTKANMEGFYYKPRIDKELLQLHHEGLIILSGCLGGEISQMLLKGRTEDARNVVRFYKELVGDDFYMEIWHQPGIADAAKAIPLLIQLAREEGVPLVATQDIHYLRKEDSFYHEILLAVQTGNKVTDDDRMTLRAGDFSMRSPEQMEELFKDHPEAIENTVAIAEKCNVEIQLGIHHLPQFTTPDGMTGFDYLKQLVEARAPERYPSITPEIRERMDYELATIGKMGFADYFLIVQDFVNWAKDHKIVVGPGRGSAAGSIISYILKITDVDPIRYSLLFERFLNPDRIQMPDIDIDFTDVRRDEVMGYLRQKYGEDSVAHIITFGTMASRAAIRDVGRALGMSYGFCDQLAKLVPFNFSLQQTLDGVEEFKKQYDENSDARKVIEAALHLEGVVRHVSVHACGTVISKGPLTQYMPLQHAPQDTDVTITQFEGHSVEDVGILKMDLLGLKNLTIIENTIRLIKDTQDVDLNISRIPLDDEKTFQLLQAGDTTGVFQLESSGMRRYLKELKPSELEDIIAMVALYRPGPMELIPQYIARKHGKETVTFLHPKLEAALGKTYGIGIYQEQMMQIARDCAGFTLSEADTLRKAIGKKIKELLDQQGEKIVNGMIQRGIDKRTAKKIWDLFPPFARYGFNRSHAVCYAVVAYQTAYLKAHFPIELVTSLFNADSGDIERIAFLVSEAKKSGIQTLPPDINRSYASFVPEERNIRFGLTAIKNVGTAIVDAIIEERQKGGPFKNLQEFLSRVLHKDLNKKSMESLIKAGVFDSLSYERKQLLDNLDLILQFSQQLKKQSALLQNDLFGGSGHAQATLRLKDVPPASKEDKLFWEKELLGFYISDHPLKQYEEIMAQKKAMPIRSLTKHPNPSQLTGYLRIGGIVCNVKKIVTKNKKNIAFAKIEDLTDSMEVVVFSEVLDRRPEVWQDNAIVIIQGKLSLRDNEPKIICEQVLKLN